MDHDPRVAPRLRDRAVDRLNGLTTGAAALGLIATAGFGTVAAITTHVPGVSASDTTDPAAAGPADAGAGDRGTNDLAGPGNGGDDDSGGLTLPGQQQPGGASVSNGTRSGNIAAPRVRTITPPARSTTRSHASTAGS